MENSSFLIHRFRRFFCVICEWPFIRSATRRAARHGWLATPETNTPAAPPQAITTKLLQTNEHPKPRLHTASTASRDQRDTLRRVRSPCRLSPAAFLLSVPS